MINKNFNFISRLGSKTLLQSLAKEVTKHMQTQLEVFAPQLSFALDFLRPHLLGLGLRVAKLSREHIELVLPARPRNLSADGHVAEGVLVMAACEALRWLWRQNQVQGELSLEFTQIQLLSEQPLRGDLRLRAQLTEPAKEAVFLSLGRSQKAVSRDLILVYGDQEQLLARIECEIVLKVALALT